MRLSKRVLAIMMAVMLLPLAACGGGADPASSSDTSNESAASTTGSATSTTTTTSATTTSNTASSSGDTTQTTTTDKTSQGTTSTTSAVPTTTTTTSRVTTTTAPVPAPQQNLANTAVKLNKDKKLTVGFIGGSVTVGTGASTASLYSWRAKTVKWLEDTYAQADIVQVNASMGGTGSYYGLMRADETLLSGKPDLVFLEFAINDSYLGYTKEDSARYMESLVRKCYQSNANMDIVLVYTTDQNKKGGVTNWIQGFQQVADHYGLTTIDAGAYMKEQIGSGKWSDYFADVSHPNDTGHDLIYQIVTKTLQTKLAAVSSASALKGHTIPSALRNDLLLDTKMIHAAEIKTANPDVTVNAPVSYASPNGSIKLSAGQSMTITFEGKTLGVYWDRASRYSDKVVCTVDGKNTVTKNLCTTSSGSYQYILFDGLAGGKHTLTIKNEGSLPIKLNEVFVSK